MGDTGDLALTGDFGELGVFALTGDFGEFGVFALTGDFGDRGVLADGAVRTVWALTAVTAVRAEGAVFAV